MKKIRVVCFGDGLTVCGGIGGRYSDLLTEVLPAWEFINRGKNDDTVSDGRSRFCEDVLALHPDILIFELGANDFLRRQCSLNELKEDYEYMIATARANNIQVVVAGCFGGSYSQFRKLVWDRAGLEPGDYAVGIAMIERRMVTRYDCFHVPDMQTDIRPNGREPYWNDFQHPNRNGNYVVAARIKEQLLKAATSISKSFFVLPRTGKAVKTLPAAKSGGIRHPAEKFSV